MVHFIMPLRSPKVANDWDVVSKLCIKSIQSIKRQTDKSYRIHLVCNDLPHNIEITNKMRVTKKDFKIPKTKDDMMSDKGEKKKVAISTANLSIGDTVIVLDPDDRVDKSLVKYLENEAKSDVCVIKNGHVWPHNKNYIFRWSNLSILTFRYDGENMPRHDSDNNDYLIMRSHIEAKKIAKNSSMSTEEVPFPAYCYVTDTSDNHSGISFTSFLHKKRFLKKIIGFRFLNNKHKNKYGISLQK